MSKTLGLAMITNNAESVKRVIGQYGKYFDKFYITVADKTKGQFYELQKLNDDRLELSYYKWNDHFGKARQYNAKQIKTDYYFWIDSDDEIVGVEELPDLVNMMEASKLDAIYLLYDYMHNEIGESVSPHWRERMIRTDSSLKWSDSRCHETLLAPNANTMRYDGVVIKHVKPEADHKKSHERNCKLLLKDFQETQDPRTAMYLGDNLMYLKEFDLALQYFSFLIQKGGWDEDKYRAWLKISEINFLVGDTERAIDAANAAEHLLPEFPDAYFQKASVYNELNMPRKVYEWVKVGMSKPIPNTLSPYDPTLYEYRGLFMGALAALELGKVDEAFELFQIVRKRSPNYPLAKEMESIFVEAKEDTEAIKRLKWLLYYAKDRGSDIGRLLNALPQKLVADPRLNVERAKLLPKKKWPEKSIVFYCGPGTEPWGPEYLDKGCGGSEEAIIYLSRELAKLGWQVTVFNDREEEYIDYPGGGGLVEGKKYDYLVYYKPWTMLNPYDEFDVFVAWRHPQNAINVKARVLCVDMHDTPVGHVAVQPEHVKEIDKFFLKSNYQWELSNTPIPEDKAVIVGNGVVASQFGGKDD